MTDHLPIELPPDYLTSTDDLTVYWKKEELSPSVRSRLDELLEKKPEAQRALPEICEDNVDLSGVFSVGKETSNRNEARACICTCFRRQFYSGTFRCKRGTPITNNPPPFKSDWECSSDFDPERPPALQTRFLVQGLYDILEPVNDGLIVFAGSTSSAKSSVAQAFALEIIRRRIKSIHDNGLQAKSRMPHLVTFEDPIEGWSIGKEKDGWADRIRLTSPEIARQYSFCLTARELGSNKDVETITDALSNARRQTPACFYVGEIRNRKDWEPIIDFAGTGHLVVATTHASSLSETVARILRANEAKLPAQRRDIGGQLQACIHLKLESIPDEHDKGDSKSRIILPTVWTRKGAALNSLVADGLSSIVPNEDFVWSRLQFLKTAEISKHVLSTFKIPSETIALKLDIEELRRQ